MLLKEALDENRVLNETIGELKQSIDELRKSFIEKKKD